MWLALDIAMGARLLAWVHNRWVQAAVRYATLPPTVWNRNKRIITVIIVEIVMMLVIMIMEIIIMIKMVVLMIMINIITMITVCTVMIIVIAVFIPLLPTSLHKALLFLPSLLSPLLPLILLALPSHLLVTYHWHTSFRPVVLYTFLSIFSPLVGAA